MVKRYLEITRLILLIVAVLIEALFVVLFLLSTFNAHLFPHDLPGVTVSSYSDSLVENGSSTIDTFEICDTSIDVAYRLKSKETVLSPYIGIEFKGIDSLNKIMPFDSDSIEIEISSTKEQFGYLALAFFIEGYTKKDMPNSYYILQKEFTIHSGKNNYSFPIEQFHFPAWWMALHKKTNEEVKIPRDKPISKLYLAVSSYYKDKYNNSLSITSVTFKSDTKKNFLKLISVSAILVIILRIIYALISWFIQLKYQKKILEMPYQIVEILCTKHDDLKAIVTYIDEHYSNEELTKGDAAMECGFKEAYVSDLLYEHFDGISFKQYLNQIRVNKAKTLLIESSLAISRICFEVGFNNPVHFHRTFKKNVHVTPSQFRKEAKDSIYQI